MPKLWLGCRLGPGLRLLRDAGFDVAPRYWPWLPLLGLVSAGNSVAHLVQDHLVYRSAGRTPIAPPPLFIIGHWRSGTTLLHELLSLDPAHTCPTTYACLFPNHFLLTEEPIRRLLGHATRGRGIDTVRVGLASPQEEELALANLGVPTPYLTALFPNHLDLYQGYRDPGQLPPRARAAWTRAYRCFLGQVVARRPGRLVIKNPSNTFRVATLLHLFPDAYFVHLVRDPYAVFASTMETLKTLHRAQGMHPPSFAGLEELVLERYLALHRSYRTTRPLIPEGHLVELRYEELAARPAEQVQAIYRRFGWPVPPELAVAIAAYLADRADQGARERPLSPATRARVEQHWGTVVAELGYA